MVSLHVSHVNAVKNRHIKLGLQ